jgi:EAL domain-containing protein (putative c-di-GMP-specific phosphodiesterase class I)
MRWRKEGLPPLRLAVNLSGRQLNQSNLVAVVNNALSIAGLEPGLLELELTESMLMDGVAHGETLRALSDLGVQLAIDDFGTGYSSLSYLKRFYVDTLKIDRSFVCDIPRDSEGAAIVTAVIALAQSLNLRVVAEGVETAEQVAFLRSKGCDELQGFVLGRPMPAELFGKWLSGRAVASFQPDDASSTAVQGAA